MTLELNISSTYTPSNSNTTYTITEIGTYAFEGCHNLSSIEILDNVTSIGDSAFNGEYTTDIALKWTTSFDNLDLDPNWILNKSSSVIIHVPEGWESTYYEKRVALGIDGCTIAGYTPEPSSNSNVGLAVGLGVGSGVLAVGGIGFGTYYVAKKKKNKK